MNSVTKHLLINRTQELFKPLKLITNKMFFVFYKPLRNQLTLNYIFVFT